MLKDTLRKWSIALRGGKPRDLNTILQLSLGAQGRSAPEQMDWLRSLVRYLRGERGYRFTPEARTHLLLQRLQQHQDWAQAAGAVITEVLARGSALRIFCEAGLPSSASFSQELVGRLVRSVLPPVLGEGSLSGVVETRFGFHVIYLEKILPARHVPLEQVAAELRAGLWPEVRKREFARFIDGLAAAHKVELHPDALDESGAP